MCVHYCIKIEKSDAPARCTHFESMHPVAKMCLRAQGTPLISDTALDVFCLQGILFQCPKLRSISMHTPGAQI